MRLRSGCRQGWLLRRPPACACRLPQRAPERAQGGAAVHPVAWPGHHMATSATQASRAGMRRGAATGGLPQQQRAAAPASHLGAKSRPVRYRHHFTDEETEVQRGGRLCPRLESSGAEAALGGRALGLTAPLMPSLVSTVTNLWACPTGPCDLRQVVSAPRRGAPSGLTEVDGGTHSSSGRCWGLLAGHAATPRRLELRSQNPAGSGPPVRRVEVGQSARPHRDARRASGGGGSVCVSPSSHPGVLDSPRGSESGLTSSILSPSVKWGQGCLLSGGYEDSKRRVPLRPCGNRPPTLILKNTNTFPRSQSLQAGIRTWPTQASLLSAVWGLGPSPAAPPPTCTPALTGAMPLARRSDARGTGAPPNGLSKRAPHKTTTRPTRAPHRDPEGPPCNTPQVTHVAAHMPLAHGPRNPT